MPTNPKVVKAFRAMRNIGIPEAKVKPVLKSLLKLYDKNWELIEEESYRALADAIFEKEEAEAAECKKPEVVQPLIHREEVLEEEAMQEDPERPLKRLRLRYQEVQASPSANNSSVRTSPGARSQNHSQEVAIYSRLNHESAEAGFQPVPCQTHNSIKGKQTVSPKALMLPETYAPSPERNQPNGSNRVKEPKTKNYRALIKPKDEPYSDDMPQFEVPIAVIHPEPSNKEGSSSGNASKRHIETSEPLAIELRGGTDTNKDIPNSSKAISTSHELEKNQDGGYSNLNIASSPFGEVKVSINCDSALGRSDFHLPSLESVLKMVEFKCHESYKILDPNFSVMKLMKDMCECFLELGTQHELLETTDAAAENNFGSRGMALDSMNGFTNFELDAGESQPEIPRFSSPCNGNDITQANHTASMGNCCITSETDQNGLVQTTQSLVAPCESTRDEVGSLHVTDITKGQEKVIISLLNDVNRKRPPSFHYLAQNVVFQNACVNFSLARIGDDNSCSTCSGDCLSLSTPCACAHETGFAYTKEGLVKEEFLRECVSMNRDPKKHCPFFCKECPLERSKNDDIVEPCKGHIVRNFIKECWWKCGCNKQCGNRVVQRGISGKLQVFMTPEGKGWGLRTLEDLPRGAFVCEYVGEVLTNTELFYRISRSQNGEEHSYPVLLDADWGSGGVLKDEEALCLDATFYGNVARFINHRCFDSNLIEIPVEIESPDHRYYHLAFFTTRAIKAMEELTWDYGIDFDDLEHPVKAFSCQCSSTFCRNIKRSSRPRSRR